MNMHLRLMPMPMLMPTPAPIPTPTPSIKPAGSRAYKGFFLPRGFKNGAQVEKKVRCIDLLRTEKSRVVVTRLYTAITTTLCQPITCLQSCMQGAGFKKRTL